MLTKKQLSAASYASGIIALIICIIIVGQIFSDTAPDSAVLKPSPQSDFDRLALHQDKQDTVFKSYTAKEPIEAIPAALPVESRKIKLGQKLFHEKRLSSDNQFSCGDCHNLRLGGTDQLSLSTNSIGKRTKYNTPSIFNVALNYKYYWSGKFNTLEDQLSDALKEINTTWPQLIRTLTEIPSYNREFLEIYSDGITVENVKDAIISFEKSLVTPNSRFDQYLNGNRNALNADELKGYNLFKSYGCITCHQGVNMGGNFILDNSNLIRTGLNTSASLHQVGLDNLRVPSLRNVAITQPYFHDGSAATLDQAVDRMIKRYVGTEAPEQDITLIVDFLKSLTGEYQGQAL